MILMQLKDIVKSFGGSKLFERIQLEVKTKDRIAIVGRNGSGKSTLLKIMTGEIDYDEGEIFQTKQLDIGYLAQHQDIESNRSILEEMMTVFQPLIEEEQALEKMAARIEEVSSTGAYDERLMLEYGRRQEKFSEDGGYRYKSDVRGVLTGLGFSPDDDFDLPVPDLSGGQKTRLALGKLLLKKPDVLILDEPTNHLDIATLTWLENYLLNFPGAIVIVSHDRYFLDKIVGTVYDIAHKRAWKYHGTYTSFLQQKAENAERDQKLYDQQQQEIKEMEAFIARNIARASTSKRAQSRRKQLDKMELLDKPLHDGSQASFSFQVAKTSGNDVIMAENYQFTHDGETEALFANVNFSITRGSRIALIGENGIGKTTLLKAIVREEEGITLGSNVQVGYYAQEQEKLDAKNTILEEVWSAFPMKNEQEIRTVLGNFLFSGDDVLKIIQTLSGGEKARVALAKLMLLEANTLILDEPTNHLDLPSKEVLEAALLHYSGTILFVSHDRYFINKIADEVFELKQDGLTVYLGDYNYYSDKKAEQKEIERLEQREDAEEEAVNNGSLSFSEQKKRQSEARKKERQIAKIETEIEALELRVEELEAEMADPKYLEDHEKLYDMSNETNECKAKIEGLMEVWTELHM